MSQPVRLAVDALKFSIAILQGQDLLAPDAAPTPAQRTAIVEAFKLLARRSIEYLAAAGELAGYEDLREALYAAPRDPEQPRLAVILGGRP